MYGAAYGGPSHPPSGARSSCLFGQSDIAIVEPHDEVALAGPVHRRIHRTPRDHLGPQAHDEQDRRITRRAERLVGDLNSVGFGLLRSSLVGYVGGVSARPPVLSGVWWGRSVVVWAPVGFG